MTINETVLTGLIKKRNVVSSVDLVNAKKVSLHLGVPLEDVLLGRNLISEKAFGEILSEYFNTDYIDLEKTEIPGNILNIIPEDIAAEINVVAFAKSADTVSIAVSDPKDLYVIETVKKVINARKVKIFVSTPHAIRNAIKGYKEAQGLSGDELVQGNMDESAVPLINRILEKAIREDASDIHIEPLEDSMLVRIRVDGVLHDEGIYPKDLHASSVARIKILSDLKLDEQRLPQDGQFSFKTKSGDKISLRVSVNPTVYGEKVVLRILKSTITHFNLQELGLLPEDMDIVQRSLERTHGMFLVTGPTGSGKTTSLYTLLGLLNKSDVNIITIEDPVENRINRINQIQVNSGINLTFASGLRSILRQDPDIIMVGEIRDKETAVIAVNAAMTGHLVFSSVHANTASGVIPRMIDLGAEPFLLASTLNLVIAQRLVRVLCPKCKKEIKISPILAKKISDSKGYLNPDLMKKLKTNYMSTGCPYCFNTGYKGRIGIFEILLINEKLKELIVGKASSQEIWKEARRSGFKTMLDDGLIKVLKGQTCLEEVFRVISQ